MARETLHSDLVDRIGLRIVEHRYAEGQILRTEDWESEFDVSRTVLREALKVLESMRLVSMRRKIGVTVLPESHWKVFDPRVIRWRLSSSDRPRQIHSLTELRLAVEPIAARNAALNATPVQRVALLYHASQLEDAGVANDLERLKLNDVEFHRLLLAASGNELFAALSEIVGEVLPVTGHLVHDTIPEQQTSPPRHLHTVAAQAIVDADPRAAEDAMRELLVEVHEQMDLATRQEPGQPDARGRRQPF